MPICAGSDGNTNSDTKVIVALDYDNELAAVAMARALDPAACRLKVGKELFTQAGPGVVEQLQKLGFEVFLDLKFHDIPNTCAKAVKAAAELGVWMVNVHASGGRKMMDAARDQLAAFSRPPKLIGVTVLTSMVLQDLLDLGVEASSPQQQVMRLAGLVHQCGLDGIVCSAQEAQVIKQQFGPQFLTVTPGIRPSGADTNDQARIMTPEQAVQLGSDYLVIGRPITQAEDPQLACQSIIRSIS